MRASDLLTIKTSNNLSESEITVIVLTLQISFVHLQKLGMVISYLEDVNSWQIQGGDIIKSYSPASHFIMFLNRRFLFNCKNLCTRRYLWICISILVYSRQETSAQNCVRCVTSSLCHRSILSINCFYYKLYYKEESCTHSLMPDCVLPAAMFFLYPFLYVTLSSKKRQSLTTGDLLRYWLACCWSKSSALDSVVDFALMLGLVLTFSASSLPDIFP